MKWLRGKLRTWLGVDHIDKKLNDTWWDINDSAGLKTHMKAVQGVTSLIIEVLAEPDKYNFVVKDGDVLIKYDNGWQRKGGNTYYEMFEFGTRYIPGNENYQFKDIK